MAIRPSTRTRPTRVPVDGVSLRDYLRESRGLALSLFYIVPLVALYEVGLIVSGSRWRNGADVLIKGLFEVFGPYGVPVLNVTFLIACLAAMIVLVRRGVRVGLYYPPLLLEAAFYGVMLGPFVNRLREGILPLSSGEASDELVVDLLLSVGAGVYEELFFRLILLSWVYLVLARWLGLAPGVAVTIAVIISAAAFAAFHYIGPEADPLETASFAFRFLGGAILGTLFAVRGLAVAVYAHTFYDVFYYLSRA